MNDWESNPKFASELVEKIFDFSSNDLAQVEDVLLNMCRSIGMATAMQACSGDDEDVCLEKAKIYAVHIAHKMAHEILFDTNFARDLMNDINGMIKDDKAKSKPKAKSKSKKVH